MHHRALKDMRGCVIAADLQLDVLVLDRAWRDPPISVKLLRTQHERLNDEASPRLEMTRGVAKAGDLSLTIRRPEDTVEPQHDHRELTLNPDAKCCLPQVRSGWGGRSFVARVESSR